MIDIGIPTDRALPFLKLGLDKRADCARHAPRKSAKVEIQPREKSRRVMKQKAQKMSGNDASSSAAQKYQCGGRSFSGTVINCFLDVR